MEHEASLSCQHEPATGPHAEPDESNPQLRTLFLQHLLNYYPRM
jgi:hypothetical protein